MFHAFFLNRKKRFIEIKDKFSDWNLKICYHIFWQQSLTTGFKIPIMGNSKTKNKKSVKTAKLWECSFKMLSGSEGEWGLGLVIHYLNEIIYHLVVLKWNFKALNESDHVDNK